MRPFEFARERLSFPGTLDVNHIHTLYVDNHIQRCPSFLADQLIRVMMTDDRARITETPDTEEIRLFVGPEFFMSSFFFRLFLVLYSGYTSILLSRQLLFIG